MFDVYRKEIEWAGRKLVLETGKIARQADGAVLATYGETCVLCTAVAQREPRVGIDFFPLTINYQEKTFAAGKIPGGFFKREGRPSEKETLTSRLIDRPIRPLFHPRFHNETQVICTVVSHDLENDPDIVALVGASAALTLSGIPFMGPIAAARVGRIDGEFVLNPQIDGMENSDLDLVVAGTQEGVLMVESEASELSEEVMLGAVTFGHQHFQPVIDLIIDLAEVSAKTPWDLPDPPAELENATRRVKELGESELRAAYGEADKGARRDKIDGVKAAMLEQLGPEEFEPELLSALFKGLERTSCVAPYWRPAGASMDAIPKRCVPSSARSGSCPGPMAARFSPAVGPRPWSSPRLAPARTNRSSMRLPGITANISSSTTTSRPIRWARRLSCARRGAARSVTASSPGGR